MGRQVNQELYEEEANRIAGIKAIKYTPHNPDACGPRIDELRADQGWGGPAVGPVRPPGPDSGGRSPRDRTARRQTRDGEKAFLTAVTPFTYRRPNIGRQSWWRSNIIFLPPTAIFRGQYRLGCKLLHLDSELGRY